MTTSLKPGEGGARRGRRGPRLDDRTTIAIQAAFFEELAAVGYGRLSVDSIVKRAGVSKAAVYRRWPSKADMVTAMIAEVATGAVEMPDTGSLRGDMVAFLTATYDGMRHPLAARIIPAILSEAGRDDALAATLRETVEAPRRAHAERLLRRAIERAELPTDCDLDLALDHMIGTLYFRVLVRRQDLDRPAIHRLADGTIAALAATRLPRSSA
ncbi:TetR/AcrR family transcriptional regulator [Streptomyces collinus]